MRTPERPTKQDYQKSIVFISVYVLALGVGAALLLPKYWYLWAGIVLAGLVWLVNWHRNETSYCCPECGHIYQISFLRDLFAPHGVTRSGPWLLLRCPQCGKLRKTEVLKRPEE